MALLGRKDHMIHSFVGPRGGYVRTYKGNSIPRIHDSPIDVDFNESLVCNLEDKPLGRDSHGLAFIVSANLYRYLKAKVIAPVKQHIPFTSHQINRRKFCYSYTTILSRCNWANSFLRCPLFKKRKELATFQNTAHHRKHDTQFWSSVHRGLPAPYIAGI